MNYKYLLIGVDIVFASLVAIGVALYNGYEMLLGVGFSLLTLGVIIAGFGITFVEPLDKFFRDAVTIYSLILSKIIEDSGLLYAKVSACLNERVMIVVHSAEVNCNAIRAGVGVHNGKAYIAIPSPPVLGKDHVTGSRSSDTAEALEDFVRESLIKRYGVGNDVRVKVGENVEILYHELRPEIIDLTKKPVNPLKLVTVVLLSRFLGREVSVVSEELVEEDYRIVMRVK